jgi:peptide/nickel transport system substrate-binding protein
MSRSGSLGPLFTIVLVAAACAPAPSTAPSTGPGSSQPAATGAPATSDAVSGGTLVVALPGDIVRTDPILASETNSSYVLQNVLEGLMGFAPGTTSDPIPVLASAAPTVSPDGLTYTFPLREGIKFHDGTDFNAEAVKYNFDRWTSIPTDLQPIAQYAGIIFGFGEDSLIQSVEAVDAATVEITLRRPNSSFLTYLTLPYFEISSPTALKAGKADNSVTDPALIPYAQGVKPAAVGTGPFVFEEWAKNDHVTIVRNDSYWDAPNAAKLDEIVFRPVPDSTAVINGLQAGDIDLAEIVSPVDIPTVEGDSNLQLLDRANSCNTVQVSINQTHPPMDQLAVRQAIGYAVNKQAYIDAFYGGLGTPADNFMPLTIQYAKPLGLPTYDPENAKSLLTGLSAEELTLDFWWPSDVSRPYMPDPKGLFEAVSSDLTAVGFTVTPHTDVWSPNYLDNAYKGQYQNWLLGITCQWAGPDNFLKVNYFGYVDGQPPTNYAYRNDALNQTMDDALAAPDAATAERLWGEAQDMLAADLPIVPLVNSRPAAAARTNVHGFVGSGNLSELLNSVWLD